MFAPGARSERVGLLWWRVPEWQRVTLDEGATAYLAANEASADFIDALRPLAGRGFDSIDDALRASLGEDYVEPWVEQVRERGLDSRKVFNVEDGPVVAYRADGYLGQYIVVVPAQRLVAVRQIRSREGEGTHPPDSDYPGFSRDVIALAQALSGDTP